MNKNKSKNAVMKSCPFVAIKLMTAVRRLRNSLPAVNKLIKLDVVKRLLNALSARMSNLVSTVKNNNPSFPAVVSKEKNLTHALLPVAKNATFVGPIQFPTILISKQSIEK
jgi:nitrogen-specific signal transduction histidine kinase